MTLSELKKQEWLKENSQQTLGYTSIEEAEADVRKVMDNNKSLQLQIANLEYELSRLKEKENYLTFNEIVLMYELNKDESEYVKYLLEQAILLLKFYEKENE